MKANYQPWLVKIEDFYQQKTEIDKLEFLLNFAVLAPSSHNSQPWAFKVGENEIKVYLEPSRRLIESDKNDRQAFISLGCAIGNILIAANYYGLAAQVDYLSDPKNSNLAARITFTLSQPKQNQKDHLIFSISNRVNNRNPYESRLPPAEFLNSLKSLVSSDLEIHIIKDEASRHQLVDIALQASIEAMEDKNFREELSRYIKNNLTSSSIGMPCFGMGIPTPISFLAPTMIRHLNMNKLTHKKDEKLLKHQTPVLLVITTKNDDCLAWLKAGQIYEKITLIATREGLSTAMWAAPIQIGEFYKDFQKILNTSFRPQAFFRLGYPKKLTKHSPRLPHQTVLK